MFLSGMAQGQQRVIRAVIGEDGLRRRLAELGFVPGTKVRVLARTSDGMIVEARGSSLAIDFRSGELIVV